LVRFEFTWRQAALAVLALGGVFMLFRLWQVVLIVVAAFIFQAALLPYVEWLVRHRIPRLAAVLLIAVAVLAALAGLFALVVPAMVDEFKDLRDNLPEDARRLEDFLDDFGINVELEERAREVDWGELFSGRRAVDYGQRAFVVLLSIFSVAAITVYLLLDAPRLSRFIYQFVPPGREPEVDRLLQSLSRVVGGYVRGQVITSAAITVYTLVVLLAVGTPNAIAFAVVAGFADIIPIVGAYIATIAPVAATFDVSPARAAIVLVALVFYQQFEDRVLVPRVYGQALNLPPLIVLVAVLAGAELLGIPGVLLALPAVAAGRVALDYYLESRGGLPQIPSGEPVAPDPQAQET
jgi:predicted PurR-regulated permease PerM